MPAVPECKRLKAGGGQYGTQKEVLVQKKKERLARHGTVPLESQYLEGRGRRIV